MNFLGISHIPMLNVNGLVEVLSDQSYEVRPIMRSCPSEFNGAVGRGPEKCGASWSAEAGAPAERHIVAPKSSEAVAWPSTN